MTRENPKFKQDENGIIKVDLPKHSLVLTFGILSIVSCMLLGIAGLILGIMARKLSNEPLELYKLAPELYNKSSYKNINAGRTCAIIGISLSAAMLTFVLFYFALRLSF